MGMDKRELGHENMEYGNGNTVWNYDASGIEERMGRGDWVWTEAMGLEYQKLNIAIKNVPPECSPCVGPP